MTPAEFREQDPTESNIAFVLNLPETSHNIWHNVHWLIPAVARLHADPESKRFVPHSIVLVLLFEGYKFDEHKMDVSAPAPDNIDASTEFDGSAVDAWVVRQAPFLRLLTASPPVLFHMTERRCFRHLLWGHSEMRADRDLAHRHATGQRDVQLFRDVLHSVYGDDMRLIADMFWQPASQSAMLTAERHTKVLVLQRDVPDKRAFLDLNKLVAAGLHPLAASGSVIWQTITDLAKCPLIKQAAIMSTTEVLVGAVGAGLAWLVVMRSGSQVLEWLPQGVPESLYRCSEAWNADSFGMFGGLGRLAGVDHVCLRSEATAAAPTMPELEAWSAV
eukprot:CAMPEP_0172923216 /NCGR_PEP_ID=MMETSP1075-20121228/209309_1 /TAXON_ID=2916 /ORGANISM="Ceratium fusus, Strain PA161109" /LENGTH=331 /DNA_ID=CAMNT_0013783657 /DNA_START=103 /DNA_END=1095 /DNA_ORIENTATION=-